MRRAQLRRLLAGYLGRQAKDIRFVLGEREKPFLPEDLMAHLDEPLQFNLSDSKDVAVVGVKLGLELGSGRGGGASHERCPVHLAAFLCSG